MKSSFPILGLACAAALALVAPSAVAQTQFWADVDGAQETPPVATSAGGWARLTLNPDDTLTYEVRTFKLIGTDAHIHLGAVGVPGGIAFPLTGGPKTWAGTTTVLTPGEKATLRSEGFYVNVHTAAHLLGEIRGQIEVRPRVFASRLDGAQEVPSVATAATGTATVVVNSDASLTYTVTTSGLSGFASHIHKGGPGINGGIELPLVGGPTVWSGTSLPFDSGQLTDLQSVGQYVNVHTSAHLPGEIRGQLVPTGHVYADLSVTPLSLTSTGPPMDGGTITIDISGGKPSSLGALIVALAPGSAVIATEPFLLDLSSLIIQNVLLPLDGSGALSAPTVLPALVGSIDLYLQFFNFDITAPNGTFRVSNGLRLPLTNI